MENEKTLIEMMQKLTASIDDFKTEMTDFRAEMKQEMTDFKAEVHDRFDKVEQRLQVVENKIGSLGEMFEHTVELQQNAIEKVNGTLHYHSHKIAEFDQEIFHLKNKQ